MKKFFIILNVTFFLIEFNVISFSYAGEKEIVIETAEGHQIIFQMTSEDKALYMATKINPDRGKPADFERPNKRILEFELAESGIMVAFPLRERKTAAVRKNSGFKPLHGAGPHQAKSQAVTIELSESGYYILFPAMREKID